MYANYKRLTSLDTTADVSVDRDDLIPGAFWSDKPVIRNTVDDLHYELETRQAEREGWKLPL